MKRSHLLVVLASVLAVSILGSSGRAAAADFTVTNAGMSAWTVNGQSNPGLSLTRGHTYTFSVNAPGHPFLIKTVPETGTANSFDAGVTGNGLSTGTLTFTVPASAPSVLYYQCQFHEPMTGTLTIVSPLVPATTSTTRAVLVAGLALVGLAILGSSRRGVRRRKLAA
jgi:hypothetical protein